MTRLFSFFSEALLWLSLASNYNSNHITHSKGLHNPCTICECHFLQEPITHWDVELQCNKSDMWVSKHWHWWLQPAAGHIEKVMDMKLMAVFKKFRLRSLLFELSLLLHVTKGEDTRKLLVFYEYLTECTCTQQTLTNVIHHYNDCKLLNYFPRLQSDRYFLRVFFSQIHVSFSSWLMNYTQL